MKTLHLVLKGVWYDKIASGEKTSEYREFKPYWNKKFAYAGDTTKYAIANPFKIPYNRVIFHRGYTSETMEFQIANIGITNKPNDLGLDTCWEIKLDKRIK